MTWRRNAVGSSIAIVSASLFAVLLHAEKPDASSTPKGNALRVDIASPADRSRQPWQSQGSYSITASYDGKSTKYAEIPATDILLTAAYAADLDAASPGRGPVPEGLIAITQSNCMGCHDFVAKAVGPSFAAIGKRYPSDASFAILADHIRNGSRGAWGSTAMPPHPEMRAQQATDIARWIVEHGSDPDVQHYVGTEGSFQMRAPTAPGPHAGMILTAIYTGPLKDGDTRRPAAGRDRTVVYGVPPP